jgi:hypothetical protein
MSIRQVVFRELSSIAGCTAECFIASHEMFPQINKNIKHPSGPPPLSGINMFTVRTKESPVPELFIMIPAFTQLLNLAIKHGFIKEWNLSLKVDMELPLLVYVGGIIEGRIPHTIVAADWKKGFLKRERIFLPLMSEKLDDKLAREAYRSQEGALEQVSRLNANPEIKALLKELNYSCNYTTEEHPDALDTKIEPQFRSFVSSSPSLTDAIYLRNEGLVYLSPVSDEKIAITVASTPQPVSFPCNVFTIFDALWSKAKLPQQVLLEEALLARKALLGLFTPYEFVLPQKIKLIELISRTIQDCNYKGEVKSRYLTEGGVSDFIDCLTKPLTIERTSVDPSIKALTKQEFLESAPQSVVQLMQSSILRLRT